MCGVRDNLAVYEKANAEVLAISVDSILVLDQFKTQQNLPFTLLSDFNKDASEQYDVLYENFPAFEMKGESKRATFVVDKKGLIRYTEVCASP